MDKIDLQIIKELFEDARKPFRKIAEKIGVSTQTVTNRYNKIKEKGIIQQCTISINLNKFGYKGTAYLLITHSHRNDLSETVDQLKKIQNIVIVSKALGDFEAYAVLVFKDLEDLYGKVLQIKSLPHISKVEVSFATPGMQHFPPNVNPFQFGE
jgi:Lrp/AsnC family transcriptional regulator for asnA, asnC and gidA